MNWFEQAVSRAGLSPLAQDDAGRQLSYGDALAAAHHMRQRFGAEKRLAVVLAANTVPCLETYLGLLAAGHAVILLGADTGAAVVADILERYQPEVLIHGADGELSVTERSRPLGGLHPGLSVLLSTSGSTGSPKIARFTDGMMGANADSIAAYMALDAKECALAHLPLQYSFGMSVVHSHIAVGARLLLTRRSVMEPGFWAFAERATSIYGVPFHFEMMERLRFERRPLAMLKTLAQAGGRMPVERTKHLAALARDKGWRLVVMYGQTEAGPRIAYLPAEDALEHAGRIGRAVPGVSIEIVDEAGKPVAVGQEGELIVHSPSVMLGYAMTRADLGKPDEMGGRLATGDMGAVEPSGYIRISGRRMDFIKLHGNRVNMAEVERRLAGVGIEASCVGIDDQLWVVLEGTRTAAEIESVRAEAVRLFGFSPRAMAVVAVPAIPRSAAQKVLYKELLGMLSGTRD